MRTTNRARHAGRAFFCVAEVVRVKNGDAPVWWCRSHDPGQLRSIVSEQFLRFTDRVDVPIDVVGALGLYPDSPN